MLAGALHQTEAAVRAPQWVNLTLWSTLSGLCTLPMCTLCSCTVDILCTHALPGLSSVGSDPIPNPNSSLNLDCYLDFNPEPDPDP